MVPLNRQISPGKTKSLSCHDVHAFKPEPQQPVLAAGPVSSAAQPLPALCGSMDCSLPGSSVPGDSRLENPSPLEWAAVPS